MRLTAVKLIAFIAMAGGLCISAGTARAGVVGSLHDLSTVSQPQVCIFCHTPHNANLNAAPLWNKAIDPATVSAPGFLFYTSTTRTLKPSGTAPSPVSLACLSCHTAHTSGPPASEPNPHGIINGTWALDGCANCHSGNLSPDGIMPGPRFTIGTNLKNDHPVSVTYPLTGTTKLNAPADGVKGWEATKVRLFSGKLECSSCHNPHDTTHGKFLARDNDASALCLTCHIK